MNIRTLTLLAVVGFTTVTTAAEKGTVKPADPLAWPPITRENKIATRWWWMGSAVNPDDLTRELKTFHEAGIGGVEITPIYGVKGYENQFIEYLSPKWLEMLKHTATVAKEQDIDVDMVTGTGWCFGGPNVSDKDANALAVLKAVDVPAGQKLDGKFDRAATQALVAFSPDGKATELTDKISADGTVDFSAPANATGPWRVYQNTQKPSGVKVKRPAPGGAGWMLNLIYPDAMNRYLQRFTDAFSKYDGPKPHAQFHDSYEYKSDWAPDFFAEFEKRRGYKLQTELPALFESKGDADHIARVKCDYRQTVSELIEESIARWTKWSHDQGSLARNQAHGSPGNWLDIYAASDIPETEMFNKDRDILVSKFASSAAHVTGKNLVGAEAGTWVAEHFTEKLSDLKYLFDDLFLSGVNRITYHGTAYSPADVPWPGWCFYASTEMNPRNAIWHDVPALNAYVARVQSILQSGRPDNDILLYWPISDFWHNEKSDKGALTQQLTVHARDWFGEQPIGKTARILWEKGYTFDYVSDKQLQNAKVEKNTLDVFGNKYRVVVVPNCTHIPVETLQKLVTLAKDGAQVVFDNDLPKDVPGLNDLENRRNAIRQLLDPVKIRLGGSASGVVVATLGNARGSVTFGRPAEDWLARMNAKPALITNDPSIHFVRRVINGESTYFITNRGQQRFDREVEMHASGILSKKIEWMDPMTGNTGQSDYISAKDPKSGHDIAKIHLRLEPGESIIVHLFPNPVASSTISTPAWDRASPNGMTSLPSLKPWHYWDSTGKSIEVTGNWSVQFLDGGPALPKPFSTEKLGSWTELGGEEAQSFAGTARYTLHFDVPNKANTQPNTQAEHWSLDLGKVCQSARVKLNGTDLGTVFIPPYRVPVDDGLKARDNVLEIEVTNTSANRIRDLDRRKVEWKKFYDINIVTMDYKPFDASNWPLTDSGLLGPVTLQPEKAAMP
jgi:hypothetical protein